MCVSEREREVEKERGEREKERIWKIETRQGFWQEKMTQSKDPTVAAEFPDFFFLRLFFFEESSSDLPLPLCL